MADEAIVNQYVAAAFEVVLNRGEKRVLEDSCACRGKL